MFTIKYIFSAQVMEKQEKTEVCVEMEVFEYGYTCVCVSLKHTWDVKIQKVNAEIIVSVYTSLTKSSSNFQTWLPNP